jgi:isopenicillin N synthase-like dioxygenase
VHEELVFPEDIWAGFRERGYCTFEPSDRLRGGLIELFRVSETFFNGSHDEKMLERLPQHAGYRPFGVEYSQAPDRPDEIESFSVFSSPTDAGGRMNSTRATHLYREMGDLFAVFERFAEKFASHLFEKITASDSKDRFSGAFRQWSHLQVNRAAVTTSARELGIDAHEDGSLLTIMANTAPGLEIRKIDGSFEPLRTSPNEMIVISGEILWLLTGGAIPPTYHRVRHLPQKDRRLAALFFADLDPELSAPWILNEINHDIDIGRRIRSNAARFGLA